LPVTIDATSQIIGVTRPTAGMIWPIGSAQKIRWTHNIGYLAAMKIEISRDGGPLETIVASTPSQAANAGRYDWTVTGPACSSCVIRVSKAGDPGVFSDSGAFTITP
jgi:hypothetical protein